MTINPFILHGEEITPVRKLLYLKALAGGAPLSEYEVTGNPVSFTTNVSKPLSVLAAFSTVQAGSGDPSPENVRSISGFSVANVYLSPTDYDDPAKQTFSVTFPALGKNLFDKNAVQTGKLWWKGNKQDDVDYNASAKIPVIPGETYTIYKSVSGQNQVEFFDIDGVYTGQELSWGTTKEIPSGVYFIAFNIRNESLDTAMFVKGSTAGEYEPYNATAYGGTIDPSTGVLTVEWVMKTVNDFSWTYQEQYTRFNTNISDILLKEGARIVKMYCSAFVPIYDSRAIADVPNNAIYSGGLTNVSIKTDECTTEADLKEMFGDVVIVYPLQTPLVYQLSPVEILSLVGDNVLWSDLNGDLTVTYKKKGS